jgi:hypothetical protein
MDRILHDHAPRDVHQPPVPDERGVQRGERVVVAIGVSGQVSREQRFLMRQRRPQAADPNPLRQASE